mgnify:CR=1 FL=1
MPYVPGQTEDPGPQFSQLPVDTVQVLFRNTVAVQGMQDQIAETAHPPIQTEEVFHTPYILLPYELCSLPEKGRPVLFSRLFQEFL